MAIECAVNSGGATGWQAAPQLNSGVNPAQAVLPRLCRGEFNALFAVSEVMPGPQVNVIAGIIFRSAGSLGRVARVACACDPRTRHHRATAYAVVSPLWENQLLFVFFSRVR